SRVESKARRIVKLPIGPTAEPRRAFTHTVTELPTPGLALETARYADTAVGATTMGAVGSCTAFLSSLHADTAVIAARSARARMRVSTGMVDSTEEVSGR